MTAALTWLGTHALTIVALWIGAAIGALAMAAMNAAGRSDACSECAVARANRKAMQERMAEVRSDRIIRDDEPDEHVTYLGAL